MIPEIGMHPNVDETTYRSWDGANFSFLKLFRQSAAHALAERIHPTEQTAAMAKGSAIHSALLEPQTFRALYCKGIEVDRRTKVGKAAWAEFEAENAKKEILKPDVWIECEAMADSVWSHPLASEILSGPGLNEVSVVWDDPETDIRCKARMDRISSWDGWTWVWDLKSARDASPGGFKRAIAQYNYHCQAAHYLSGLNALDPRERRFGFIAIEATEPYCVATYELEPTDLEQGQYEVGMWLKALKEAQETATWPGYPLGIQQISLPVWRRREYEYGE